MGATIVDRDLGWTQLRRRSRALDGKAIRIGVQGEGGGPAPEFIQRPWGEVAPEYPLGVSVAQVAVWHEFGLGVPERSFVRAWLSSGGERTLGDAGRRGVVGFMFDGRSVSYLLEQPGREGEIGMRETILARIPPPLSQRTVDDPGRDSSEIPLYDTGQIYGNTRWAVDR